MLEKINFFKKLFLFCILFFGIGVYINAQSGNESKLSLNELEKELIKVLDETGTASVGIALLNADSNIWVTALGKADLGNDLAADENTLYRIGSVSKMFVSLSILKLKEEGLVSLKDKVRDIIPEIEFTNRWESKHPILVEHLLEHTTGWDDIHLSEYALNAKDMTLKEGLDFHPHSRTSRWIPGTRMSYCNSGPPVAAYIVEKITGQTFEGYVEENFFKPLGMNTTTYFQSDLYKEKGASLYSEGRRADYWHIIMRPSGSINSSPADMSKYVRFLLNRGEVDSVELISKESMERMENSETTVGARAGLEYGYGLSNYTSTYENWVFHGHNGGVNGGLTELAYLPAHQIGYIFMINSGNGDAFRKISKLVRKFLTQNLTPVISEIESVYEPPEGLSGYYININPRNQMFYFLDRIFNVRTADMKSDTLLFGQLIGKDSFKYLYAGNGLFRSEKTGKLAAVITDDPLAGRVLQVDTKVYKSVSAVVVFGQFIILALWFIALGTSGLMGIIWIIRLWMGKIKGGSNYLIRLWPFLASVFFVLLVPLVIIGGTNPFMFLGKLTFVSGSITVLSYAFGFMVFFSLYYLIRVRRKEINVSAYIFSVVVTLLHLLITIYLMWHGIIGLRTWA